MIERKLLLQIIIKSKSVLRRSSHTGLRSVGGTAVVTPVYSKALHFGDRVAIIDESGSYSYNNLYGRAKKLAETIEKEVPGPGSKITFLSPNSSEYIVAQWAIWMAGGVAVPLCKSHPLPSLRYYVEDSGSVITLATPDLAEKLYPLENKVIEYFSTNETKSDVLPAPAPVKLFSSSPAMILYTSGTTGPPKGVVLSHGNLESQANCLISSWRWVESDKILHVLPLHHTHGIVNCLLCPLNVGASIQMLPGFDAARVWSALVNNEVNIFMAVPTIYAKLIEYFDKTNMSSSTVTNACKGIRLMVSGSAALPTPVLERWKEITGHTLLERYGMTEIGMALSNPLDGVRVPGAVGSPLPGVSARIVSWDKNGNEKVLVEGEHGFVSSENSEPGELLIRGPNVFQEYLNKPEATKKEFTESGWFKTGDTCKVENGVFRILGRTSVDIIKSGGYKISALDIERILLTHPRIQDVAVVGVPDPTWGEKVGAVVVVSQGQQLTLQQLR
ncbi:acyl-CoA synthetase family member 3, mitochondrial [Eurytemora carolleeae]|uniref:acyl-CoA synthetase family member 3, mitochondrial n=1 Tax=Eurytemora carolleeae TaxID=1294199 RepID=UPI000C785A67|nr:acyl-CoA synthetase family member 3, mitochondrial [Eurytemora carolleeae]|eukprot:XP_023337014.1 acyl-CoA synthetase family member 3, mitochondrial-like [Eurytemora affinis]